MILEYNYEKALHVLDLLKEAKIAVLDIKEDSNTMVMEYKLVEEYPEHVQRQISRTLTDAMPRRLRLIEFFNNLIVTKTAGKEIYVSLHFNAVGLKKCEIEYEYDGMLLKASDDDSLTALKACLERVDNLITTMGISSQKIDLYRKEGSGKQKRYVPITLRDFSNIVNKIAEE